MSQKFIVSVFFLTCGQEKTLKKRKTGAAPKDCHLWKNSNVFRFLPRKNIVFFHEIGKRPIQVCHDALDIFCF